MLRITLMRLTVHAEITAVDIREQIGAYACMIHGSVEHREIVGIVARHIYLAEILVPRLARGCLYAVKIPFGNLCLKILARTVPIDSRYAYLHIHLLILFCRSKLHQSLAAGKRLPLRAHYSVGDGLYSERLGKFSIE